MPVGGKFSGSAKISADSKSDMPELYVAENPKGLSLRSLENGPDKCARRKFPKFPSRVRFYEIETACNKVAIVIIANYCLYSQNLFSP